MTRKSNLERDEIRAKFAAIMTGISRALERPEEAESILRELKMAEKMDRKVLPNKQIQKSEPEILHSPFYWKTYVT